MVTAAELITAQTMLARKKMRLFAMTFKLAGFWRT
jgi:hypothetical protein